MGTIGLAFVAAEGNAVVVVQPRITSSTGEVVRVEVFPGRSLTTRFPLCLAVQEQPFHHGS